MIRTIIKKRENYELVKLQQYEGERPRYRVFNGKFYLGKVADGGYATLKAAEKAFRAYSAHLDFKK